MHQAAIRLTDYLIKNEITATGLREEYIYSFEVLFGKIINYGTLFLLAVLNKNILETIIFMCVFFTLRTRTGGYHASKAVYCYLCTYVIYFFTAKVFVPFLLLNSFFIVFIIISSVVCIFIFAPVNHPNLELDKAEIKVCRKNARIFSIILSCCILTLMWLNIFPVYTAYAAAGMGLDTGLILLSKIIKQEVQKK